MGELSDFKIGQEVVLQDGRTATVRFVGDTNFAPGDWIGVELEDNSGKNDGTVQGQRYFDCEPGRGMFVRPAVASVMEQPTPKPARKTAGPVNGAAAKSRPSSVSSNLSTTRRQSVLDPTAKRQSINAASPTPSARGAVASRTLRSPMQSPTKQLSSRPASISSNPRAAPPSTGSRLSMTAKSRTSISGRPSMAPPTTTATRPSRTSTIGATNGTARSGLPPARKPSNRLSMLQQSSRSGSVSGSSQTSGRSEQLSPAESTDVQTQSPMLNDNNGQNGSLLSPVQSQSPLLGRPILSPKPAGTQPRASISTSTRPTTTNTASNREVEDLKTKLRLIEKKRMEDRDRLKELEKVQGERDKFESIIQKLQAKLQPQQQELVELRRRIKDAEARADLNESQQIDIDAVVEEATLDKEMAEENAEACKIELEALRQKYEELEVEVEILREENSELGKEMSPEEKTSQGWLQLERSNERLREALMRLRDMTQEQEVELKQRIQELEKDVQDLGEFRGRYEETVNKLDQSETAVDELRQQLEMAQGAEEMIEELTDKNMSLVEQTEELKLAIEDLESLKELNDELELNHVENEKQLQDEIDYREAVHLEQVRKVASQDETIDDLEYTISRFRELVGNLQSDLEDMRASQQITETEANELSSRSRAMMDLNLRLQVSASKAQVKAIEVELGKLEAQELADHLAIMRHFLPDSYASDRNSIETWLGFKRIGFKANLLHGFIKERLNGVAVPGHEEDIFVACDILDRLTWISNMCSRFISFTRSSSLDSFQKLGGALYDLEHVERSLNGRIEALKRDDLKEKDFTTELQRSIALMSHLAEVHITDGLREYAEDVHMRAVIMQGKLENAAAAVSHIKAITQTKILLPTDADEDDEEEVQDFLNRADNLVAQIRSAKVISSKSVRQLEELQSRSLTLDPTTQPSIEKFQDGVTEFAQSCCSAGVCVVNVVNEGGRTESLRYGEITRAISPKDSMPFSSSMAKVQDVMSQVQNFYNLTTMLSYATEFPSPLPSPPWELLSQRAKEEALASIGHEKEVGRLRDELAEKKTALAMKDKIVEEMSVSVEVLERRVGESGGRRERLRELEATIEASKSSEQALAIRLASLEANLRKAKTDRDAWKRRAAATTAEGGVVGLANHTNTPDKDFTMAKAQEDVVALRTEISSLQSTIRYLRQSAHSASLKSAQTFLNEPLVRKPVNPKETTQTARQANDVLESMLDLITQPGGQVVQLHAHRKEERLAWRPVHQSTRWKVVRQREEWEGWREWRDEVAKLSRESTAMRVRSMKRGLREATGAKQDVVEKKFDIGEPAIVGPEQWDDTAISLDV